MTTNLAEWALRLKWRLVAVSDERGGDPLALAARLPAGAWLIFRHYNHPDRSVLAAKLAAICRARRVTLLIAGDFSLAIRLRAGIHLQDRRFIPDLTRIRLCKAPLSVATHDRAGLLRAAGWGAHAALLSPIFDTFSHPGVKPLGLLGLRRLLRQARLPVVALGGIDGDTARGLREISIMGVAAVTALRAAGLRNQGVPGAF